jgi:hypothetical protein
MCSLRMSLSEPQGIWWVYLGTTLNLLSRRLSAPEQPKEILVLATWTWVQCEQSQPKALEGQGGCEAPHWRCLSLPCLTIPPTFHSLSLSSSSDTGAGLHTSAGFYGKTKLSPNLERPLCPSLAKGLNSMPQWRPQSTAYTKQRMDMKGFPLGTSREGEGKSTPLFLNLLPSVLEVHCQYCWEKNLLMSWIIKTQ